ncbi:MAG: 6-phosphofructokinase [Oligoflexia bacterium]|nr:6-phosphofructokinase [Oligoflexia bacterium]MBF0364893.1 6-phosphofructokinase [Oligoflexia bacterium]
MKLEGKVLVAQGGGPTAVINQSLVGVVAEARKFTQATRVYGAVNGVRGIIDEEMLDLTQETTHNLEDVATTPSSALFSTRDKPDAKYCQEMFKVMKAHDIRYFFYIGGNDSSDTVRIINESAKSSSYDFCAVHIPKTVDNDLVCNDHTPGFGSAARYVTNAFIGINLDVKALPGVYIGVVMGRNAGFLTASAAIAQKYADDGPHLIYLPERPFSIESFHSDVKRIYDRYGRCVVAVSEGIRDKNGDVIASTLLKNPDRDDHGNIQLSGGALADLLADSVKHTLGIKRVRADTFGYPQRSFFGCVSDVDAQEAREVGERAVQLAMWQNMSGSITIQRTGNYSVDYQMVALEEIAAKTRLMPDNFINAEANHVTDAFKFYVRPLLGSGLLSAGRLRAPSVKKLLLQR